MTNDDRLALTGAVAHGLRDHYSRTGRADPAPEVVELIVDRVMPVVESIVAHRTAQLTAQVNQSPIAPPSRKD